MIFHQIVTSQWPIFSSSFFFQLRLIKWSSCLFFPLSPEAENTNFGETYSSFVSLPLFHPSVDGQPLRGLVLPAWHFSPSRALPCSSQHGNRVPALGSQVQPGHMCQGMGTANGSDSCWLTVFLLFVWSHAVSWKFRGDFSMGWWHRNSLCASVHWPDEPNGKLDEPCRNCLKENW